jgi:hypothetical protein
MMSGLFRKVAMLLEELNLKRPQEINRLAEDERPSSPPENDQKGTDEPWKLPGQSSQQPEQKPPSKPNHRTKKYAP